MPVCFLQYLSSSCLSVLLTWSPTGPYSVWRKPTGIEPAVSTNIHWTSAKNEEKRIKSEACKTFNTTNIQQYKRETWRSSQTGQFLNNSKNMNAFYVHLYQRRISSGKTSWHILEFTQRSNLEKTVCDFCFNQYLQMNYHLLTFMSFRLFICYFYTENKMKC